MSAPVPTPDPSRGPAGLLLCRDLIFTSKVTGTARALGAQVVVAGNGALAEVMIGAWTPRVVFVDLAAGDLARPDAVAGLKALVPDVPFIAFGSHVEADALVAAKAAGCELALPRSRFTTELPDLIRRYLAAESDAS